LGLASKIDKNPPRRELDMLISAGERISMSLLAMSLNKKNIPALSFTGSQMGIITTDEHCDARIIDIKNHRIRPHFESKKVIIVAGFQGMSLKGDITTLGRGGSDTTAVALAVCFNAERVEFYKDVNGIFEKDPKSFPQSSQYPELSYEESLSVVSTGAQILHMRSLLLAKKYNIPLLVKSFKDLKKNGTFISNTQSTRIAFSALNNLGYEERFA
jgi:aspartate kinase